MSFRKGIGKRSDHRIGVKSTAFQDRNNKNFTTFLKNPIAERQKIRLLFSIKRSNDYRWGNKELMSSVRVSADPWIWGKLEKDILSCWR